MVQLASHATNKAQSPVVAATTTATTMIVPIVIVQTPVCASERCLDREMVGKRARMLTSLITGTNHTATISRSDGWVCLWTFRYRRVGWLPFLDTYRALCLAPTAGFLAVPDEARRLVPTD